jgi:DNA-binding GntR family transcriptional regulator
MPPLKQNAHTEKACDFIRDRIISGAYPPGFRLKTIDLASESGVSRTPVREALRQLQQEGLVDILPRQGARVRTITFQDFKEMCELRLAMESLAAELAALNRGPEDLVEMEDAIMNMKRLVAELEKDSRNPILVRHLAREDIQFHSAILNAAGNQLLKQEVLRFHLLNKLINTDFRKVSPEVEDVEAGVDMGSDRLRYVLDCHSRILAAIVARQPDAARTAMYEHLKEIIDRSMVAVARSKRHRKVPTSPDVDALHASG